MIDPLSSEGRAILAVLDKLKADKMKALVKPTLSFEETQYIRGQVKGFKTVAQQLFPQVEDNDD